MKERIVELKNQGYKIIYLDECGFTTKTLQMNDYTNKNTKHCILMKLVSQPAYSLVLAISEESELEHYGVYRDCVNQEKFNDYLNHLSVANKHKNIAILMDNFSAHKTPAIMMKMEELQIKCIFNVPYQPDYNPTEACFSKIKNHFKRQKLNRLVNDQEVYILTLIDESVNELTK